MLEIRTERLQLIALTLSQLGLYVAAPGQREKQRRFQPCAGEGRDADIRRDGRGFGLETG